MLSEKSVRRLMPTTTTPPVAGFYSLEIAFDAVEGERIYGLGQHAAFPWDPSFPTNGQLNQKGVPAMLLEPHDGDVTIPVAHSSLGYAFLSNLPSVGSVVFNATGSYWSHAAVLQADMWITTTADSPPHAVSPWQQLQLAYADATGHSPVWPEWSSGFWQCKLRYSNQSQAMAVANEYVRRNIPLSLMVIDYFSWDDPVKKVNTIGDETLPASCWPDPALMVEALKAIGVELMISPYSHSVGNESHYFAEAASKRFLAIDRNGEPAPSYAGGYAYDLFQPAARAFAWNAMQSGYVRQYGLHHWWLDCDEPCGGTNNGSYATDWLYNNGTWPSAFVGAAYPQMLERTVDDGMRAAGLADDNVMLGRAAWAGSQRLGGGVWSGDTSSTWQDLNQQFRAGLNMVMSGIVVSETRTPSAIRRSCPSCAQQSPALSRALTPRARASRASSGRRTSAASPTATPRTQISASSLCGGFSGAPSAPCFVCMASALGRRGLPATAASADKPRPMKCGCLETRRRRRSSR